MDAAGLRACIEALCDEDIVCRTPCNTDNDRWQIAAASHAELSARTLQRLLYDSWRVTSYSGLQQRGHSVAQDLIPRLDIDAAGVGEAAEAPAMTPHHFPRGASPGTFLHSLFEELDFTQPINPQWVQEKLELSGFETRWEPVLTRWLDTVLHVPLNETGVSLSVLTEREKQVEMEFYLPIAQPLTAGELDALIRRYDPLSAGCPALDFMQVRGMLKGFIDRCSVMRGAITCSTINLTGWARIAPLIPRRRWLRRCRRIAMICSTSFIRWHCTVTFVIEWRITTMNAISAASSISFYAGWIANVRSRVFLPLGLRRR